MDAGISAEEIAQWYYWRRSIESFFKRIEGAGHGVCAGMATATRRGRGKCAGTTRAVPVIGASTKAGTNGKHPGASGGVIRITEHADVVVRVHAGRTDPSGNNRSGHVRRCVDTYALEGGIKYRLEENQSRL